MRKKIRWIKRGLAVMLSVCLVFGVAPIRAGAEGTDSGIAVQANDSAGKTEQQSTDEASVTINGETLYYATLEEAFSAADGKTATITMLNDAECTVKSGSPISVMNKSNITLNMNGKTLSGQGTGDCGIITLATGSLSVQGPGTMKSTFKCLSCQSKNAKMTVENITFDVSEADYGVWVVSSNTVTLNNIQIIGKAKKSAVYQYSKSANVTINNMNAIDGGYSDVCFKGNTLKINGGTFDKISVDSYYVASITSVSQVLGEGCIYRYADKTWETSELSNTLEISNVTVEKIPLTINPEAETSWYYNSAEHSLHMNAEPTTAGNDITYEWYDGDTKLECDSDTYTIPKTMPAGSYTYTCKATCDGYTLSHEFTFTVEECKHEGIEITFNSNGFGNCPKCNAIVYQPAVKTTDQYDIDDDGTKDTVYEISNAGQLYWFAGLVNGTLSGIEQNTSANAILMKDITVNANLLDSLTYDKDGNISNGDSFTIWSPIGNENNEYSGTFDGNNKTVSGLYFNNDSSAYIGLLGKSDAYANIKNVGVVDSYFKGYNRVGGVCGYSDGSVTNCYNTGNLTAIDQTADVGGVCGYNGGTVTNCYNTGTVTSTGSVASVGGVCGSSLAPISNCYNIGTVTAASSSADISGICGYNYGPVTNCYYLADTEDENGGKTTAQFASGEIAYLLSQGCTVVVDNRDVTYDGSSWGQKLGENGDEYPVLKKAGDAKNTVYRNEAYPGCEGNPGDPDYSYSNTQETPVYAEHWDKDLDGKCDICKLDFKTFKQLGLLIAKVNKNLSDGKYADVQYTTASIDNLRKALVAAGAITEASSDTDVATAFDKLLAASTVDADGLVAADHNVVIAFANEGAARGIASGNGWYANGDTVTLKVTPSVGYSFSKWTTDTAGHISVGTESTYTFILGADSPDAYYAWLDEIKYTVTCESTEGGTCTTSTSDGKYVYGQTATVTATASDGYEFVGWKDIYGTTVSTDAVYSFTVIGDATLTPEFVKVKTDEGADIAYVTVSFYHQSGKLLDSQKVVSGEGKITTTVNAPTKVGFDFLGWSAKASGATAEDVVDFETATFSENTSLYPVFKAQDITYTLTVGLQTEQKAPQSSVTVTADPIDGKQFVGWKDANGNIVSYDSTYTFIITGDTTLTAYYEQADSEVVKEPAIIIAQPTYEDITGGYKMAFYFNYSVPEDCELVDIGIIRKKGDYEADGITLETDGVSQYSVLSKLGSEGQFYYTKSNYYGTGHTVTGYMIYEKNGIRYTVYSDSIYGVKNN